MDEDEKAEKAIQVSTDAERFTNGCQKIAAPSPALSLAAKIATLRKGNQPTSIMFENGSSFSNKNSRVPQSSAAPRTPFIRIGGRSILKVSATKPTSSMRENRRCNTSLTITSSSAPPLESKVTIPKSLHTAKSSNSSSRNIVAARPAPLLAYRITASGNKMKVPPTTMYAQNLSLLNHHQVPQTRPQSFATPLSPSVRYTEPLISLHPTATTTASPNSQHSTRILSSKTVSTNVSSVAQPLAPKIANFHNSCSAPPDVATTRLSSDVGYRNIVAPQPAPHLTYRIVSSGARTQKSSSREIRQNLSSTNDCQLPQSSAATSSVRGLENVAKPPIALPLAAKIAVHRDRNQSVCKGVLKSSNELRKLQSSASPLKLSVRCSELRSVQKSTSTVTVPNLYSGDENLQCNPTPSYPSSSAPSMPYSNKSLSVMSRVAPNSSSLVHDIEESSSTQSRSAPAPKSVETRAHISAPLISPTLFDSSVERHVPPSPDLTLIQTVRYGEGHSASPVPCATDTSDSLELQHESLSGSGITQDTALPPLNLQTLNIERTPNLMQDNSAASVTKDLQEERDDSRSTNHSNCKGGRKSIRYFNNHRPFKINTTDKKNKNIKYMVCVGKDPQGKPCKTTAKLDLEKNEWNTDKTLHVCEPDRGKEQTPAFEALLKRLLRQDRESDLERCYLLAQKDYPDAAELHPLNESMLRKMRGWRSEGDTVQSEPLKNIEELTAYLERNPEVLQYILNYEENPKKRELKFEEVVVKGHRHLILYDPELAHRMRDSTTLNIDGTFDELPNLSDAQQLLVIMMQKYGKGIPVFYVIMSRRRTEDYRAVMQAIKRICPGLKPKKIITDYEKALRKALRLEFKGVTLIACYFHFCQALFRQGKKKKIAIRSNRTKQPEKHLILRRFMALALLPSDKIQDALDFIIDDCKYYHGDYFDRFIKYFNDEYMKVVTAKGFSVYGENDKTNNKIESFNSYLLRLIGKKPLPNKFIRCLQAVHVKYWIKLSTLEGPARAGRPVGCSTSKKGIARENFIKEKWAEYLAGTITANDFVISCARYGDHVDIIYEDDGSLPADENEMLDDEDDSAEAIYLKNGATEDLVENQNTQGNDDASVLHHRNNEEVNQPCLVSNPAELVENQNCNTQEYDDASVLHHKNNERVNQPYSVSDPAEVENHQWAIVPAQPKDLGTSRTRGKKRAAPQELKMTIKRIR
ncbi:hypothetical protein QAD02_007542 [Eretmocerus hayati]|uniref:Uncharacterized protein n=1 Tax=Eretmocerus hayati TaxID=131215 RepID=A0ACC2N8A0_9HYME|nr:hypothetical protein QAD02_007542 [Eretmocerus hayati]